MSGKEGRSLRYGRQKNSSCKGPQAGKLERKLAWFGKQRMRRRMVETRSHIMGHKSSLSKFKKTEIISSIFSDHNAMRLEMNYGKKTLKTQTHGG